MKDTLKFNLPEEKDECFQAHHAGEAFNTIEDIIQFIRNRRKWPPEKTTEGAEKAWDEMWEYAWEAIREHGLRIWE